MIDETRGEGIRRFIASDGDCRFYGAVVGDLAVVAKVYHASDARISGHVAFHRVADGEWHDQGACCWLDGRPCNIGGFIEDAAEQRVLRELAESRNWAPLLVLLADECGEVEIR